MKRVDSVDGLVCLPWHKDCDRGGHSMFCAGLTIGICLTPVDEAHGGLDVDVRVTPGEHRSDTDRPLARPAGRDPSRQPRRRHRAHVLHTAPLYPPTARERRVAYTGFALPPRPGDSHAEDAQSRLRQERVAIGGANGRRVSPQRSKHDDCEQAARGVGRRWTDMGLVTPTTYRLSEVVSSSHGRTSDRAGDQRVVRELAESRTAVGRRRYREVMASDAPPPMTPYLSHGVVDSVFGEILEPPWVCPDGTGAGSPSPAWVLPRSTSRSNSTCTPLW